MTGDINIFNKAINAGHSAAWDQDWSKAVEKYRTAVDEFPENPKALRNLGLSLFQLKKLEQSMQIYRQAASLDSKDSLTMERIALIAERLGQIDLVVDYGFPGQLNIYADVVCCGSPSAVENDSWGCIKALYR
jgi:tetratricopeptide (TPR) repeat protein